MSGHATAKPSHEPWVVGLFVVGLYNLLLGIGLVFKTGELFDFGDFYASACGWWQGTDPYVRPNLNPPHASVLIAPLCALAPYPAWFAWQVVNLVAWLAALRLAWRTRRAPLTFGAIAVLVAHGSTSAQVHMGQVAWLLGLPMTLSWLAFRRGAHVRAGLWLGIVLAAKPFLVLAALPALVDRRWRVTWLLASAAAGGIVALGYVSLGGEVYARWAAWSAPAMDLGAHPMNVSLTSLALLLGVSPFVGIALGVAATVAWMPRWRGLTTDRQWMAMLTLLVLSAPLGWLHYTAWALPMLWAAWPTLAPRRRFWALVLVCMPMLVLVVLLETTALRFVYPIGFLVLAWTALGPTTGDVTRDMLHSSSSPSNPIINS